jgi:pimeloyl-ACP methyl ester carboxylesterase
MRILEEEVPGVYASAPPAALSSVVVWSGGSPHTGALLAPVVAAARSVGRDVVSVARPGYGGAARRAGRTVADAAGDIVRVLDILDVDDVVIIGYSGGGPHAIAAAVATPKRTRSVLAFGCIAPYDGAEDWFAGMADPSALKAALLGLAARRAHHDDFDPASFIPRDYEALEDAWHALGVDVEEAQRDGLHGMIDDDLALVRPWGFTLGRCDVPTRLVHGGRDAVVPPAHALALAAQLPRAVPVLHREEGHVSVLELLSAELHREFSSVEQR